MTNPGQFPIGAIWENTFVRLPRGAPAKWRNIFGTDVGGVEPERSNLQVSEILREFPLGLIESEQGSLSE